MSDPVRERHRGDAFVFASGKGGVGKTNIVANLALLLAAGGRRVLAVDGDLGLPNLDLLLGMTPTLTVGHFLEGTHAIEEIAMTGPHGLRMVPATSGVGARTRLGSAQIARLRAALRKFGDSFDVTLVDGPAGISAAVTQLVGPTDSVITVTSPEPAALIDAYALIKALARDEPRRRFGLIVNNVEDAAEGLRVHANLERIVSKFLSRTLRYWGHVVWDEFLVAAVRERGPVTALYPESRVSRCFESLTLRMITELETDFRSSFPSGVAGLAPASRVMAYDEMETIH